MEHIRDYAETGISFVFSSQGQRVSTGNTCKVYKKDGYTIVKTVAPKGEVLRWEAWGHFIEKSNAEMGTYKTEKAELDFSEVENHNEACKQDWINLVMKADLTVIVAQMNKNEESFKGLMKVSQESGNTKAEAFLFACKCLDIIGAVTPLSIQKVMLKYGHDFETKKIR